MKQQAELALADLPFAPAPLRVVAAAGTASLDAATAQVATIHTLFPAIHHVQVDRSARCRARDLWAATKRAAELSRGQTASRLWSRRWSRLAAHPWSPAAPLTGPAAVIPVDDFAAYLAEAERAFPADSPADLLSRIRNTYYSGFLVSQLLPDSRAHGSRTYGEGLSPTPFSSARAVRWRWAVRPRRGLPCRVRPPRAWASGSSWETRQPES